MRQHDFAADRLREPALVFAPSQQLRRWTEIMKDIIDEEWDSDLAIFQLTSTCRDMQR